MSAKPKPPAKERRRKTVKVAVASDKSIGNVRSRNGQKDNDLPVKQQYDSLSPYSRGDHNIDEEEEDDSSSQVDQRTPQQATKSMENFHPSSHENPSAQFYQSQDGFNQQRPQDQQYSPQHYQNNVNYNYQTPQQQQQQQFFPDQNRQENQQPLLQCQRPPQQHGSEMQSPWQNKQHQQQTDQYFQPQHHGSQSKSAKKFAQMNHQPQMVPGGQKQHQIENDSFGQFNKPAIQNTSNPHHLSVQSHQKPHNKVQQLKYRQTNIIPTFLVNNYVSTIIRFFCFFAKLVRNRSVINAPYWDLTIIKQINIRGENQFLQLHRITKINDAFLSRYSKIQDQIGTNIQSKRQQLLAQIHRIEYRIEEIKYVKTVIERDARLEYESLLERLKSAEGTKLAILYSEMTSLQKDIDFINNVGSQFTDLTQQEIDPSSFLLNSRQLYESIERIIAKPFKTKIDVFPYDLPRELTELRLQLQKAAAQKQIIEFKNEIIWKLVNEKVNDSQIMNQELEKQTTEEVNEWAKLVDKFQIELNRFHVMCCYCGILLDPAIINLPCKLNRADADVGQNIFCLYIGILVIKVPCQEAPPSGTNGTEKHFFSRPLINEE